MDVSVVEQLLTLKLPNWSNLPILEVLFCKYLNYTDVFAVNSKLNWCVCTDTRLADTSNINKRVVLSFTSLANCLAVLVLMVYVMVICGKIRN